MPLYEYECEKCAHRFERIQKFSDPPIEQCPVCSSTVRKLLSSPAIQFKGSGWYITDYAKKGSGDTAKPAAASGEAGASADSKPDAKSDAKETKDTKASQPSPAKSD